MTLSLDTGPVPVHRCARCHRAVQAPVHGLGPTCARRLGLVATPAPRRRQGTLPGVPDAGLVLCSGWLIAPDEGEACACPRCEADRARVTRQVGELAEAAALDREATP